MSMAPFAASVPATISPLKLDCGKTTMSWRPRNYIGAHVWLVVPHFAEETAFAISIAQEFHVGKTEQEFEVWLVSVRRDKAAIVHATVSRALLAALDRTEISQLQTGLVIGQLGASEQCVLSAGHCGEDCVHGWCCEMGKFENR